MSDSSVLKKIAELVWTLELDGARAALEVVQKVVETKETVDGGTEKIGMRQDEVAADELREVRRFLDHDNLELSGPECVLLGSFFKHRQFVESLDTRSLNVTLDSFGRKPSNTTSTVEGLEKKGLIDFVSGEDRHAHKTFCLTEQGYHEARDLIRRLKRRNFAAVG